MSAEGINSTTISRIIDWNSLTSVLIYLKDQAQDPLVIEELYSKFSSQILFALVTGKLDEPSFFADIPFTPISDDTIKKAEQYIKHPPVPSLLSLFGVSLPSDRYFIMPGGKIGRKSNPQIDGLIVQTAGFLQGRGEFNISEATKISNFAYDAIIHYKDIPIVRFFFTLPYLEKVKITKRISQDEALIEVYKGVEGLLFEIYDELNEGEIITDNIVESKVRDIFYQEKGKARELEFKRLKEKDWLKAKDSFFEYARNLREQISNKLSSSQTEKNEEVQGQLEQLDYRIKTAEKNPDIITEISLGALLNFFLRAFNVPEGNFYHQDDRKAILNAFKMSPASVADETHLQEMSPEEFVIRAYYFGSAFWDGNQEIGKISFSDFSSVEPLLGMLDYKDDRVKSFCGGTLIKWVSLPASAQDISRFFSRIYSINTKIAFLRLLESRGSPEFLNPLSEIVRNETDIGIQKAVLGCLHNLSDAGAIDQLCVLLRNNPSTVIEQETKKVISKLISDNNVYIKAFPKVTCGKCSEKAVKTKVKAGLFRSYQYVICPRCKTSSFLFT